MSDNENLVVEFSQIIQKYYDVPREYADAAGVAISSACFGPFFKSQWVPEGECNVYFVLSSLPGFTRRSTVQKIFDKVVKAVYRHDIKKIEEKRQTDEEDDKKLSGSAFKKKVRRAVEDFFIETGNAEGITDNVQAIYENGYRYMFVVFNSKEFGNVLKKIFDKSSWEKGTAVVISKMFYGEGGRVNLSRRGGKAGCRYLPEGMYAVLFVGMQEMKMYMSEEAVEQGTGRRILVIHHKPHSEADIERYKDYINESREGAAKDIDEFIEKVIKRREYLRSCLQYNRKLAKRYSWKHIPQTIDVLLHGNVEKTINDLSREMFIRFVKNPTIENCVRQSDHEHLLRTAMCIEIAKNKDLRRLSEDISLNQFIGLVTEDSCGWARNFLDKVIESTKGQYDDLGSDEAKPLCYKKPEDKLYEKIVKNMPDGVSRTELMQQLGWHRSFLGRMLSRLYEQEKILEEEVPTRTKTKRVYKVKEKDK